MHGLLHMISQKQKKIYPRGKINMRRNLRKSFPCSTFYKRMCLGTFSRLARSLAIIYIFARVHIFGTLVSFYVTGHSSEFPVTQKSRIY